jgi:hypothetical protein
MQQELQSAADWIILCANNDSGISRGYAVLYRVEGQNGRRELTAMSGLLGAADRPIPYAVRYTRLDISSFADPLGRFTVVRGARSRTQCSH